MDFFLARLVEGQGHSILNRNARSSDFNLAFADILERGSGKLVLASAGI
jgi:hypothetical protein